MASRGDWYKDRKIDGERVFTRTLVGTGLAVLLALTIELASTVMSYLRHWGVLS